MKFYLKKLEQLLYTYRILDVLQLKLAVLLSLSVLSVKIWAASRQNQQNECAPSEDSDQPGHLPSLISVFAVRSMGS